MQITRGDDWHDFACSGGGRDTCQHGSSHHFAASAYARENRRVRPQSGEHAWE